MLSCIVLRGRYQKALFLWLTDNHSAATTTKQAATSAVRMGGYHVLRQALGNPNVPIGGLSTLTMGSLAGVVTVYATKPFDTVKTRAHSAVWVLRSGIFFRRGLGGFWSGSTMRLGRLVLSGGIVFSVYEHVAALLSQTA